MGIVQSQPPQPPIALPPNSRVLLNIKKLSGISAQYEQLLQTLTSLQNQESTEIKNLQAQKNAFQASLAEFQAEFEKKLQEQLQRNQNLNAREKNFLVKNAALKLQYKNLSAQAAQNTQSAENKRANAIRLATQEAMAEKERLQTQYKSELAEIQGPLQQLKEEYAQLQAQHAQMLNNSSKLNQSLQNKKTQEASLTENLQKLTAQIQEEQQKVEEKRLELTAKLEGEMATITTQKMEELNLELEGIRKKAEEDNKAILETAQIEKEKLLANAKEEIATLRKQEEAERLARLNEEKEKLELERQEIANQRAETEASIRALEQKALTNSAAAQQLQQEKAELEKIKAEQATFEQEKQKILAEQEEAKQAIKQAQEEAQLARNEAKKAVEEKQLANLERARAEKVEKYRKHLYQIIKNWIGPLEKLGIKTYHNNAKDDYFFQKGTVRKNWIEQKTIDELNKQNPLLGLKWVPRPNYNSFVGGKRKTHRRAVRKQSRKYRLYH